MSEKLKHEKRNNVLNHAAVLLADLHEIQPASGSTREIALAKTKLEECVMWAEKAIEQS